MRSPLLLLFLMLFWSCKEKPNQTIIKELEKKATKIILTNNYEITLPGEFITSSNTLESVNSIADKRTQKTFQENVNYLKSGIVAELRVYGDFISKGVAEEIAIAREFKIPVIYKSKLN